MSGVEVVGITLAVMPLIITAIEDYNDSLDPVKAFLRWERELPQFIRKLRNQHVHFAQTMRLLLEPITTEFELAEMLSDPSGQMWKDENMSRKLKDKLQESFQAYQSTIADIERIMKKIASKLDLNRAANITRNDLEAMLVANPQQGSKYEFKKRVRFGMSKKTIKGLLEELDECNKELERYTDRSEKLETLRKVIKPSFANRIQRIQDYAKNLHSVLLSSWACSCRSYHNTSLQLEQRANLYASGMKKAKLSQNSRTSFTVSFSSFGTTEHTWTWQEAEIRIEDDDGYVLPTAPMAKPKMAKTVSFGDKEPPPPYSTGDPAIIAQTLQEVKDLCAAIQQLHKSCPCIGFSFDSERKLRGVYPIDAPVKKRTTSGDMITLDELLNHPPLVNGRPAKLSRKERYSLAVTLASSTLQLNSTPWFPDQWSKKDIVFPRTVSHIVDTEHPYVVPRLPGLSKDSMPTPKRRGFQNKNTVLLALAIALLELYFGISAEKRQEAELGAIEGASNPWTLCAMAYEWTESEQENLSAAFLSAVTHCLRCFSDPGASLQDPDFLQAAVEGIVLPLQDELWQFLGKTAP
ncbi:uncharacterized protein BDR25DRAFT_120151 [Lindgomyces ingoldianus]|uniref:Uncharacterized protein n=1 Tax=Lindgomyces ingoldianus TaxID=673940 RepID=A0ACB6R583_9PLEO|nr:uncharacterized protein BDR25DRAFT_120151 [Lindgomyces ingoldianus]KAF2474227.1 hypothetical protein BDR25DRAFT_120151 [Lindgomyces ingoldianus]